MILTIMLFFINWVTCENSAGDNDCVDGDDMRMICPYMGMLMMADGHADDG